LEIVIMTTQTLGVGRKAPAFSLLDQEGRKVTLTDFLEQWVVVYFYPKDDTPGCTTEACEFTTQWGEFEKLQAAVLGVSPDSPQSHKKFIDKHGLKITLLSDPDHKVLEAYDAWGEKSMYGKKYEGVLRSTFLIDPAGKVAFHWPKVSPAGHAAEVAAKLAELQA
jgi:peroxiredoxin Q/BCP